MTNSVTEAASVSSANGYKNAHAGIGQHRREALSGKRRIDGGVSRVHVAVEREKRCEVMGFGGADCERRGRHSQSSFLPNIFFSISAIGPVVGSILGWALLRA